MNEIYDKKEEQIKHANDVYNQLVNESENLTANQTNQVDSFITNSTNNVNQSVDNNIGNLASANNNLENRYQNELKGALNDYNNYISLPINESNRIYAQNAIQNRQLVATESREQAYQEYLNQSEKAKLTGDASIAQLALDALKQKLNLRSSMNQYNSELMQNQLSNNRALDNNYWTLQQNYNSAMNDVNSLKENQRQFNETLAYQKVQDKIANALAEKEYQLAVKNAKRSASRGSSGSGGITLDNSTKNTNISSTSVDGNAKYYSNYTPRGLSKDGSKVFNQLANQSNKNGYVTLNDIQNAVKGISKDQQGIILSAFKEGSINPTKSNSNNSNKLSNFFKWW